MSADSEWNVIPQLDGMMGEDTDEDDGAVVHDDEGGLTEEDDDHNQIIMMHEGGDDHLVTEDHEGGGDQQLDMSLEDLEPQHHQVSADGDLLDTTDQLIDQSIDGMEDEELDHKDVAMLAEGEGELKKEPTEHHEGELLAAELLQQLHEQKVKEEEEQPQLADEADLVAAEAEKAGGAGLLDTLAQAAALQKVVAVVAPQPKKEKAAVVASSLNNVNKRRSDVEEATNNNSRNSVNKWYTVGVIQGLSHTVAHFFDWTCDEEGATRRRRRVKAEEGDGGDKKRRLDVKNGSNGTSAAEEELGQGSDSEGEDTGVAMYNNQPLTLDNLPDFAAMTGVRKMNLEPGTGYRFRIAAINNCGRGEWSEVSREGKGNK